MIRYFFWEPAHVTQSDPVCEGVMSLKKAALWTSKAHPDLHVFVAISHPSLAIAGAAGTLVAALLMVTGCGCRGAFPAVAAHTAVISAAGTLLLPALFPVSP